VFVAMFLGVVGVLYTIGIKDQSGAFGLFFAAFMWLFFWSGVGNASTFQMIPNIMRRDMPRLLPDADGATRKRQAEMESAAIIGFTSAIGAFGGFFIPKGFGASIGLTGSPQAALFVFLAFYASCVVITWWVYSRPGSLLRPPSEPPMPAGVTT
jgi:NNP family nitrate/nitrite transporter-like MFS transporter